jgi:hypothetical protein
MRRAVELAPFRERTPRERSIQRPLLPIAFRAPRRRLLENTTCPNCTLLIGRLWCESRAPRII